MLSAWVGLWCFARDRELASNILDRLYGKTLKPDDLQVGFSRLVGAVDDLALDVPQAHDYLAKSLVSDALGGIKTVNERQNGQAKPRKFLSKGYYVRLIRRRFCLCTGPSCSR